MVLFILYLSLEIIRGRIYTYNSHYLLEESIKYLFYPIGFYFTISIFRDNQDDNTFLKQLLIVFLVLGAIIALQMFYYYFFITHGDRVLTRQANLLLISLMTSITLMAFYSMNKFLKILLTLLSIIYSIGILIFMQRSLWIGTFCSIIAFLLILFIMRNKKSKSIIPILLIIIMIFSGGFIIYSNYSINTAKFEERFEVLDTGVRTFSVSARILSYLRVFSKIKENYLLGKGMGDVLVTPYLNQRVVGIVDNSYIVILWKLGLIGLIIFMLIYFKTFKQLWFIIKNSQSNLYSIVSIIFFSTLIGYFVNGLACVIMTLYYFNFIWAAFIAITDFMYRKVCNNI
ncbi:MAG: O-antigen ligase family protein [Candidatus Cloacimonadota bacterium]|nr:O-antigen ligase family protein [Candidatus Cloacimonadota bacterium]